MIRGSAWISCFTQLMLFLLLLIAIFRFTQLPSSLCRQAPTTWIQGETGESESVLCHPKKIYKHNTYRIEQVVFFHVFSHISTLFSNYKHPIIGFSNGFSMDYPYFNIVYHPFLMDFPIMPGGNARL